MYFILNHSTSKGLLSIYNLQIRHWGSEPLRDFLVSVVLSGSGHSGNWIWADVCKACVFRAWMCATFSACVRAPGYPGQETCPHFAVSSDWPPAICAFIAPWTCYVLWNLGLFFFPLALLFIWIIFSHLSTYVPSICPLWSGSEATSSVKPSLILLFLQNNCSHLYYVNI